MKSICSLLAGIFALLFCGCTGLLSSNHSPQPQRVLLKVSPASVTLQGGNSLVFSATTDDGSSPALTWSVNGIIGGSNALGTISAAGLYTAPAVPPSPNTVTIAAVETSDTSKFATASVTISGTHVATAATIYLPTQNALVPSRVHFVAATSDVSVHNLDVYEGTVRYSPLPESLLVTGSRLDALYLVPVGQHAVSVLSIGTSGAVLSKSAPLNFTVLQPGTTTTSPANGAYVPEQVHFVATSGDVGVAKIEIYENGVKFVPLPGSLQISGNVLDANYVVTPGKHNVLASSVDSGGNALSTAPALTFTSSTISPQFFGMDMNHLLSGTPWPAISFGTLRPGDTQITWGMINTAKGVYNWANLDTYVNLSRTHNVDLVYTFLATPSWALPHNINIQSISRTSNVVTVLTSVPHGVHYSDFYSPTSQTQITLSGVSDLSFNGTFYLTGTPDATTLTFAQTASNATSSGGTVSAMCGGPFADRNACAEAPLIITDWDNFVTAFVAHVGPGAIKYWEMWNEANISQFWRGDPQFLVTMAEHARSIIKSADPSAMILSPSNTINFQTQNLCDTYDRRCGSNWLRNWLSLGGKNFIDVATFHGYPEIVETPENIQGMVDLQRAAMSANGVGSLPVWDTESSWGENQKLSSLSDQTSWVARHFVLEQSKGVDRSVWYAYDSSAWGTLWDSIHGLNSAGIAYEQVYKWLAGATLSQTCTALPADATTIVCQYVRPNGYAALVIWNTAGAKSYNVPSGFIQYRDLSGNLSSVSGSAVPISTNPILVENFSAF